MAATDTRPLGLLQRERAMRPDLLLVLPYLALSAFGLLMVYTATASRLDAAGSDPGVLMKRQAVFVVVGIVLFIGASMIESRPLKAKVPAIYLGTLTLLLLVLTPLGGSRLGASRWIELGPFQLQPSEFAKVGVILALAALLSDTGDEPLRWHHLARVAAVVAAPAALIFLQPDLGTMLVFTFIAGVMLFVAGTTWRQLVFLMLVGVVGIIAVLQADALEDYQLTRITAFMDDTSDLSATANYNQEQSVTAIGSGGFLGKGLLEGTQTNLSFVPEQETDFIFTAVGEQLGFVGGVTVLALYLVIIWRLLVAAVNARDRFSQLLTVGVAGFMVFHVFVNVGMTLRLMPVTGLPLPFLSSGGTAFLAMSLALGLGHGVWMRRSPVPGERQLL
ncbi:MAG TPA: rod shape-determining protein RodA [Acidimicrobiia bacterium]